MNKIADMFHIDLVKEAIKNCPKDEIVIICGNWPINRPEYNNEEIESDRDGADWDEFEQIIGISMYVNDYCDLCCDPHNIMED